VAAIAGANEVTIEMLLGHASPKMWRRYAGVVPPAVEEAVQKKEAHFFGEAVKTEIADQGGSVSSSSNGQGNAGEEAAEASAWSLSRLACACATLTWYGPAGRGPERY
jgi:hypothetical protein